MIKIKRGQNKKGSKLNVVTSGQNLKCPKLKMVKIKCGHSEKWFKWQVQNVKWLKTWSDSKHKVTQDIKVTKTLRDSKHKVTQNLKWLKT